MYQNLGLGHSRWQFGNCRLSYLQMHVFLTWIGIDQNPSHVTLICLHYPFLESECWYFSRLKILQTILVHDDTLKCKISRHGQPSTSAEYMFKWPIWDPSSNISVKFDKTSWSCPLNSTQTYSRGIVEHWFITLWLKLVVKKTTTEESKYCCMTNVVCEPCMWHNIVTPAK